MSGSTSKLFLWAANRAKWMIVLLWLGLMAFAIFRITKNSIPLNDVRVFVGTAPTSIFLFLLVSWKAFHDVKKDLKSKNISVQDFLQMSEIEKKQNIDSFRLF